MQELTLTRNITEGAGISVRWLVAGNMPDCYVRVSSWSFFLPACQQYHQGQFLEVSGSLRGVSDNGIFQPKRLTVQSVNEISLPRLSVKHWWGRAQAVISQLKTTLIKKGLLFLPPTQAQLVAGMVFGGTASLSQELTHDFQVTGLTHVVSASGYNVSVVAGIVIFIFSRWLRFVSRGWATTMIVSVVWAYALSAQLVPPVVRSSIMISLNILASRVFFRQYNLFFSLALTVLLMLWWEPFYAQSLSFWLSTLATLGIILFLPLLEGAEGLFSRLSTGHLAGGGEAIGWVATNVLKESFLVTLAAQSLTLPLIAIVFDQVSLLSFVTNTVLIWMTPIITLAGLGLMLMGVIFLPWPDVWAVVGPVLSWLVWWPTTVFLTGVSWFGQFEWGLVRIRLPW